MRGEPGDGGEHVPDSYDVESLKVAREEANRVIGHQIKTLSDIDDKASDTLRYSILFLGLLLTALSIVVRADAGAEGAVYRMPSPLLYLSVAAAFAGVLSILATVVLSISTYIGTEFKPGPSHRDLERYSDNRYTEEEWLILLVRSSPSWIEANARSNNEDARQLQWALRALATGVVLTFAGVTFYAAGVYVTVT